MSSVNKVIILGRLGQDPELRYTQNQKPVATLSVATTSRRMDGNGNSNEETEWHRVIAWNKIAENCSKFLSKGRMVFVEGKLQTRSWEDQSGNKKYATEIIANSVQFIADGCNQNAPQQNQQNYTQQARSNGNQKFQRKQQANGSQFPSVPLDDVPF